jgi:hypothetical protein
VGVPLLAHAHISVQSGPSFAAVNDVVIFGVGHGCEGEKENLDTTSVTIEIPDGVTSVRPELSGFDDVSLETDKTGAVVAVTWTKDKALASDLAYYEIKLRLKAPDEPFTVLELPAHQSCISPDGKTEAFIDWVGSPGDTDVEPAPLLYVLPPHQPGWNKYTVDTEIKDLEGFFADAEIVWQGKSAFSVNPSTVELIAETDGVSSLSKIKAGSEIWVKY